MSAPSLSVVVPNYNHAHFLPECLDSLLSQSIKPLEIIVIDDCSKDNSLEVLENYKRKNPLVSYLRNEKNMGVNATLNRGLEVVRGELVFLPGADDRVMPGHFENSLSILEKHPGAGLCFSDPASFDHETGKVNENKMNLSESECFFSPDQLVEISQRRRLLISGGGVYRTRVIREAGGYVPELKWHADYFTSFTISFRHGACYVPKPLTQWRATPQSYMTSGVRRWNEQKAVIAKLFELLDSPKYSDVKPHYQKSAAVALVPRAALYVLARKRYWSYLSFLMLKRAAPADVFWSLPHPLQRILRSLLAGFR